AQLLFHLAHSAGEVLRHHVTPLILAQLLLLPVLFNLLLAEEPPVELIILLPVTHLIRGHGMEDPVKDLRVSARCAVPVVEELVAERVFDEHVFTASPVVALRHADRLVVFVRIGWVLWADEAEMLAEDLAAQRGREFGGLIRTSVHGGLAW